MEAYPGQDFYIHLAVVGYGYSLLGPGADGTVPGAVRAYLNAPVYATLGQHQVSQIIDKPYCMNLGYSVYTLQKEVTFQLIAEQNFIETVVTEDQSAMLSIRVNLNDCPLGFMLSPATKGCVCSTVIGGGDVRCYIYGQKIFRQANTWLGFKPYGNVIVHHNCPFGYCNLMVVISPSIPVTTNVRLIALEFYVKMATASPLEMRSVQSVPTLTCCSYFHWQWLDCFWWLFSLL